MTTTTPATPPTTPNITDYGNGTYTMFFAADTQTENGPMIISAQIYDLRNIFVMANTSCTET